VTPNPKPTTASNAVASYIGDMSIDLSASDAVNGAFGIRDTFYRLDGSVAATGTHIAISAPASGTATHTLVFWSTDWSGNVEASHSVTFTVAHDNIPPVTTSNVVPGKTYIGDQTFTLTPTDANSAVGGTWWKLDGGGWNPGTSLTVTAPARGTAAHTLYWYSSDAPGNLETQKSVTFSIAAGKIFTFTGATQTFTVPSGITTIAVTMDGGTGGMNAYGTYAGGAGGRVVASVNVTATSVLTVRVGGVGVAAWANNNAGGWPNGGSARGYYCGGGGGSTSLWLAAAELVEAGGGGGAGYSYAGGAGGTQGTLPGGYQTGTQSAINYTGGGGGGWNAGLGGATQYYGGTGGKSYIAIGTGTITAGVNTGGNGTVTITY
jgi:hypothetical protein